MFREGDEEVKSFFRNAVLGKIVQDSAELYRELVETFGIFREELAHSRSFELLLMSRELLPRGRLR